MKGSSAQEGDERTDSASANIRRDMADAKMFGRWVDAAIQHEVTQRGIEGAERHANGSEW
ncbi:Hypothetical protein AJAP_42730 (plasmid) [Amycolatopsis japonica]|uniref:Uncharacterized protein n=1 Tax=Amycolatopsis japonica TaxID=208439 RepID=A0A075V765_9PSEU|nr:hypothetical protein [Amycolatopsis japonica]AIG81313.1 Hypothetical protein AJAP_42730 [Amycolatopsis japonica]